MILRLEYIFYLISVIASIQSHSEIILVYSDLDLMISTQVLYICIGAHNSYVENKLENWLKTMTGNIFLK